jgi:hypothetical protein
MRQDLPPLIHALCQPGAYPHTTREIELIETHISWVLLTGEFAYKLKKNIELPFLDFSSLQRRHHFCREELRLNRRLAPEVYLDVVAIGGTPERPIIGSTPAIEYAVKMRQFPADATVDKQLAANRITGRQVCELAAAIARFHMQLEPASGPRGDPAAVSNLSELAQFLDPPRRDKLQDIAAWTRTALSTIDATLDARRNGGAVRECHGDLHLENLACIDGHIVPFDALEFDPALRCVDVLDEIAFAAMDFMAHERDDLAFEFLNSYLEHTGDYSGLRVMRHFLVKRALIRAKVHAIKASQSSDHAAAAWAACDRYLNLASRLSAARRPLLLITRGLSGSGKTTLSDKLLPKLGAIRVRSDLERKRLHGLGATDSSGSSLAADLYDSDTNDATYATLANAARQGLAADLNMIVDASFLSRARRLSMRRVAAEAEANCLILDCRASDAVLRQRIRARARRGQDASEATTEVLDHQLAHSEDLDAEELRNTVVVQTDGDVDYELLVSQLTELAVTGH